MNLTEIVIVIEQEKDITIEKKIGTGTGLRGTRGIVILRTGLNDRERKKCRDRD